MDYIQPGHLYTRILENIPWKADPNAPKGDPRKSVKWIDVSFFISKIMKNNIRFSSLLTPFRVFVE